MKKGFTNLRMFWDEENESDNESENDGDATVLRMTRNV